MTDHGAAPEVRVIEVSGEQLLAVLEREPDDLSGTVLAADIDGALVVYCDGLWTFNLFLFALAWTMGPEVEPELEGYEQTYHTLAQLTMAMFPLSPAPDFGDEGMSCKLPAVRFVPSGGSNP